MTLPFSFIPTHLRFVFTATCVVTAFSARAEQTFPADQITFFEKEVRPILAESCYDCHGAKKQKSGLRLDSRDAVLQGNDDGQVVQSGKPSTSKLILAVKHAENLQAMPKGKPALSAQQVAVLEKWVQMGLPWPKDTVAVAKDAWKQHWAFQPIRKPALPLPVAAPANPKGPAMSPLDTLVAAKLKTAGLDFAPAPAPATLCRRLYFTLTGLPPAYEDVQAFIAASAKNPQRAVEALVDTLLGSPRYGERWGRYWLDIARYSDTEGYTAGGKDNRFPNAYTYRDWVVKSLNDDLPYDQFILQQLAADKLLPQGKTDPSLAALGFLTVNDTFLGDRNLQTDDRIDVVGRGLLGVTVGCARCHDHKYDPIPSKDYYSLYSVFNSCDQPENLPIIGQPTDQTARAQYQEKVAGVEAQMQAFRDEVFDDLRKSDRLRDYLLFANTSQDLHDAEFRGAAGKAQLRDRIASRWRDFVKTNVLGAKPNPVMAAWKEFAALPADQFETQAVEVAKHLSDPATGTAPVVRNELAKRPAPKSMTDVAALYADIFLTCISGTEPNNADWQQVRQMLTRGESPMNISKDDIQHYFTRKDTEHMTQFQNQIKKLEITEAGAPLRAMVMEDKPKPADVRVFIRGNPARQGELAPRGFLTLLGGQKFQEGSGRLELAKLIASKDNPLTARVIVNRVWMQHFGRPLVAQPSDFGVQSPKPPQADLLDYLAASFMEQGWSLKKLHRMILTSRTFLQSSKSTAEKDLKDPENQLLCHFNRQRLDYEAMRDSLLAVSGGLNVANAGGHSTPLEDASADARRSVYLVVDRYEQATVPAAFDFANPDSHSPQRFVTTVPQQALFLMNSPFMHHQTDKLASQIPVEGSAVDSQTINALYHRVLLRDAKPDEVELAQRFLNDAQSLQKTPTCVWHYGAADVHKDPQSGTVTLGDFTEYQHFTSKGTLIQWTPSAEMPDRKWSFCLWSAGGGHPGEKETATIAQWTAPFDADLKLTGILKRPRAEGDGIHGWILSSRTGLVFDSFVAPQGSVNMRVPSLQVKKGDVLSFAVTCEANSNSDAFTWSPLIERHLPGGKMEVLTESKRDFCGPNHWPLNRTLPQSVLSQLVQVLLMANEFQFVD